MEANGDNSELKGSERLRLEAISHQCLVMPSRVSLRWCPAKA